MIKKDIDYNEFLDPLGNLNNLSLSTEDSLNDFHNLKYMYDFTRDTHWIVGEGYEKLKKASPLESFHRAILMTSNNKSKSILTYNLPEKNCPSLLIRNSNRIIDKGNKKILAFVTRLTTHNYEDILEDILNDKFNGTVKKSDQNIRVTNHRIYYFYMNKLRAHMMDKFAKGHIKSGMTELEINELGKKVWSCDKFLEENKEKQKKHINLFLQNHASIMLPDNGVFCCKCLYNTEEFYHAKDGKPVNWIAFWLEMVE